MNIKEIMKVAKSAGVAEQISKMTGISEETTVAVVENVLPLLVQGMQGQAKNKKTQKSFAKALEDHADKDTQDVKKFIKNVDMEDGAKIVKHLLGAEQEEIAAKAKKGGIDTKTVLKIMAILAPLLMSKTGSTVKKSKKKDNDDMLDVVVGLLDGVDAGDIIKIVGQLL